MRGDDGRVPVPLQIAVAQPPCVTGALISNAEAHALTVLAARARLVVFPELSLTGYDLAAPAVALDDPGPGDHRRGVRHDELDRARRGADCRWAAARRRMTVPPVGRSRSCGSTPTAPGWSTASSISGRRRPSTSLPARDRWCSSSTAGGSGSGSAETPGSATTSRSSPTPASTCTWPDSSTTPTTSASSAHGRPAIATTCRAYVGFASFAGPTVGGYDETAGRSAIFGRSGAVLAETSPLPGGIARALLV